MRVVCIDDNEWIGESIRRILRDDDDLVWDGWFHCCHDFLTRSDQDEPCVIVLDLDIPGEDAFASLVELTQHHPNARVLILSGYLGVELVDRALNAGAWGYISKNEDIAVVRDAIARVVAGELALSPAVVEEFQRQ